ncbi:MAG: hypothetical protein IT236_03105 [Bacteroidia bacterium]|nr:hypothetical protein [Bacteroidia bacterium]
MSKKIIILTIPGIGTKESGYSRNLEDGIIKYSKNTPLAGNFRLLEARPFSIAEIDENQRATFERLDTANNLGGILSFRRFVMEAFGDGVTFEREANALNSSYRKIHKHIKNKVEEINVLAQEFPDSKIVIVAGSLGAHVLSTYIWDADHNSGIFEEVPATANNNLRNLSFLATIGCNIPLFVSGLSEDKIIAIDKRNPDFTWDNYFDSDDVLGWPLKQLSNSYNNLVTDYQIQTGLYVGSHVKYWGDKNFTKPFTKKLVDLY